MSLGVLLSSSISSFVMGRFLGSNGWAVGCIPKAVTKMGVVTEVVVEMVLKIAESWNFTEGTHCGLTVTLCLREDWNGCVFGFYIFQIIIHAINNLFFDKLLISSLFSLCLYNLPPKFKLHRGHS